MDSRYFTLKVVEWYDQHHRKLPWRETKDPYKIWLSEVILQQTRVVQGLPYYLKFIDRFPTVHDLATAKEQEVLRLWQGLGYYTRARNLHKCAKAVVNEHGGEFPTSFQGLRGLPGIGDYTAAAIASISFHEPVAVLDGNVFRVLSRVFGVEKDISSNEGRNFYRTLANQLVSKSHPDLYNQAVMEFGALHCTPRQPKCEHCIFFRSCEAYKQNIQLLLPVKSKAKTTRNRYIYYLVLVDKSRFAMKKRDGKDIWKGLFDFHVVETKRAYSFEKLLENPAIKNIISRRSIVDLSKPYKHVLSHQNIHAKFIVVKNPGALPKRSGLKYYTKKQIADLPKPILIQRFLVDYNIL